MKKDTLLVGATLVLVVCGLIFFYQLGQRAGQQSALEEIRKERQLRHQRFPDTQVDLSEGVGGVVLYGGRASLRLEGVRPAPDPPALVVDLSVQVGSGKPRKFTDLKMGSAVEHDGLKLKIEQINPSRVTLLLGDPDH